MLAARAGVRARAARYFDEKERTWGSMSRMVLRALAASWEMRLAYWTVVDWSSVVLMAIPSRVSSRQSSMVDERTLLVDDDNTDDTLVRVDALERLLYLSHLLRVCLRVGERQPSGRRKRTGKMAESGRCQARANLKSNPHARRNQAGHPFIHTRNTILHPQRPPLDLRDALVPIRIFQRRIVRLSDRCSDSLRLMSGANPREACLP